MRHAEILSEAFSARVEAVEALRRAAEPRSADVEALSRAAFALEASSARYGRASIGAVYSAFADLLRIVSMLVDWRAAVLAAAADADRFLRGAQERYRLWAGEYGASEAASALVEAAAGLPGISSLADVGAFCGRLAATPLPIGVFADDSARRSLQIPEREEAEDARERPIELSVAFLQFLIDGTAATETHYITPGEAHDLDIEVRVARWPETAATLQLSPVTIEPPDTHAFPTFILSRPFGDPPFSLRQRGRAVLKTAQGVNARPFEFKYVAQFLPRAAEQPVAVVGQRTLRIEGFDLTRAGLTGYAAIDRKILQIRDQLRNSRPITEAEIGDVLTVLSVLGNLAGRAVQDASFKGAWTEAEFQREMRAELRRSPRIGSDLDEHPHAAGGITDLSFHGVPIELKVEPKAALALKDCARFVDQTASYAVAKGKRVGILCVLDCSPKKGPPFPAEEGIGVLISETSGAPVHIVTLLVQGNPMRPSDLSR